MWRTGGRGAWRNATQNRNPDWNMVARHEAEREHRTRYTGWWRPEVRNQVPDPDGKEKKDDRAMTSMDMDMALGSPNQVEAMDANLWLGDTGASSHMTKHTSTDFS